MSVGMCLWHLIVPAADKNDNFTDSVIIHHVAKSELRENRKVKQGVARSRHDNWILYYQQTAFSERNSSLAEKCSLPYDKLL